MGMIVWQGISVLDGVTPLVVIATGLDGASGNGKTGAMVQTFILRADVDPMHALRNGLDGAVCGVCPHKSVAAGGTGACYVRVYHAPLSTWRAWQRGNADPYRLESFRGRRVRFGSYGDPAAVPLHVWQDIAGVASGTTGYTHQWRAADPGFATLMMASADSVEERRAARLAGYRTFRVRAIGTDRERGEVVCPASDEAGNRVQCETCLQCSGTASGRRADITIAAHGASRKRFAPLPLSVA